MTSPYDTGLDKNPANYVPLSPLSFLAKAAYVYPDHLATVHGGRRLTWQEVYARCRQLAYALQRRGTVRVCRTEGRFNSDGSRSHRILPKPHGEVQSTQDGRVRPATENLDGQNTEIRAEGKGKSTIEHICRLIS